MDEQNARKILDGAIAEDDSLFEGKRTPRPGASWGLSWRPIYPDSITIGEHDLDSEYSYEGITLSIRELEAILWWMKNKGVFEITADDLKTERGEIEKIGIWWRQK